MAKPDVRPAYLRVVGATYLGVAAVVRWRNFRAPCCEDCFQRGAAIVKARLRFVNWWVFLPVIVIMVAYVVLYLGLRNEKVLVGVMMVTGLLWMLGWFAMPLYLARLSRRETPAFLGPKRDEQLRRLAGVKKWGASKHLVVLREIPAKEEFIDLTANPAFGFMP